mmetsp:Transcript_22437/g.33222  ORF Transcript_22437/g.33222 Transcript_22437/m.33222 type:complete len:283 (+) Transcript_22437:1072-1920(+)
MSASTINPQGTVIIIPDLCKVQIFEYSYPSLVSKILSNNLGLHGLIIVLLLFLLLSLWCHWCSLGNNFCICNIIHCLVRHHSHDTLGESSSIRNLISTSHTCYIIHQQCKVSCLLALLVSLDHLFQILYNRVLGVDLQYCLIHRSKVSISTTCNRLGLHITLHSGAHSIRSLCKCRRRIRQQGRNSYFINDSLQLNLEVFANFSIFLVQLLLLLLGILIIFKVQPLLGGIYNSEFLVITNGLNGDFIQWFRHEEDFVASGCEFFNSWLLHCILFSFACDVVD